MFTDHKYNRLDTLRNVIAVASEPLFLLASIPADAFGWVDEQVSSHQTLIGENRRLAAENRELQGRMLRFRALEEENGRLRTQLSASLSVGDRVTLAELVGVNLTPYRQEVIIGKGSTAYNSSPLGSIYRVDLRSGQGEVLVPVQNPDPLTACVILGMRVDPRTNYLFAAGCFNGNAFVYDADTGAELSVQRMRMPPSGFGGAVSVAAADDTLVRQIR